MRRLVVLVLAAALLAAPALPAAAAEIALVIDGRAVATDVAPVLESGRVLVPLRVAGENLGFDVAYDAAARTVTLARGDLTLVLTVNETTVTVRSGAQARTATLDVPARVVQGRTLVPIRFISEQMGARVSWDGRTRTVTIATGRSGGGSGGDEGGPAPVSVTVTGREFSFSPAEIRVKVGQTVMLTFKNEGDAFHTLTVDGIPITLDGKAQTRLHVTASAGSSASVTFVPTEAGSYDFICAVSGHAAYGMTGKIVVEE